MPSWVRWRCTSTSSTSSCSCFASAAAGATDAYNPPVFQQLPLQSGARLGAYEILSAIAAGGMGEVYRARDDSRELFFTAPPGVLQMVRVTPGDRLEVGGAQTLFPVADLRIFGVATDGGRFLAGRMPRVDPPTDIVVVQHAFQELPRQP